MTDTIAYHPEQNTVIELCERDGVLTAALPSGELVTNQQAEEVLFAVLDDTSILVREVQRD